MKWLKSFNENKNATKLNQMATNQEIYIDTVIKQFNYYFSLLGFTAEKSTIKTNKGEIKSIDIDLALESDYNTVFKNIILAHNFSSSIIRCLETKDGRNIRSYEIGFVSDMNGIVFTDSSNTLEVKSKMATGYQQSYISMFRYVISQLKYLFKNKMSTSISSMWDKPVEEPSIRYIVVNYCDVILKVSEDDLQMNKPIEELYKITYDGIRLSNFGMQILSLMKNKMPDFYPKLINIDNTKIIKNAEDMTEMGF